MLNYGHTIRGCVQEKLTTNFFNRRLYSSVHVIENFYRNSRYVALLDEI